MAPISPCFLWFCHSLRKTFSFRRLALPARFPAFAPWNILRSPPLRTQCLFTHNQAGNDPSRAVVSTYAFCNSAAYEFNPYRFTFARRRAVSSRGGLYFLQSLLINLALGYPFSLLLYRGVYLPVAAALGATCPSGQQKALLGYQTLVRFAIFPLDRLHGAPNFNTLLALHSTNMEESSEIRTIPVAYRPDFFIFCAAYALRRRKLCVRPR